MLALARNSARNKDCADFETEMKADSEFERLVSTEMRSRSKISEPSAAAEQFNRKHRAVTATSGIVRRQVGSSK
jgi:hypothetical protein